MTAVPIPLVLCPQLQALAHARNVKYPDATLYNLLISDANYLERWHTKELFHIGCPVTNSSFNSIPAAGSGARTRWRFAAHLSPKARNIYVQMTLASVNSTTDAYGKLIVKNGGGSTLGTAEVHFGNTSLLPSDLPVWFGDGATFVGDGTPTGVLLVTPDTDIFCELQDVNGRLVQAVVYEVALDADTANGYIKSPYAATAPIFDDVRQALVQNLRTLWKRGASHLLNWTVDQDSSARTRTSATAVNIIDNTSGAPSSSTPGYTLDLLQKGSERRGNVPVVLQAYTSLTGTPGLDFGHIEVVDSSNVVVLDLTVTASAGGWASMTGTLPASVAKYDLRFKSNGTQTLSLYAVSLYQYEA